MRPREGRVALAAPESDVVRVRVAALILLDDNVVLVRHRKADSVYHLLPGGGVEYGETLASALVREVFEETGLSIECGRPLVINDTIDPSGTRHLVSITFSATITGGTLTDTPLDARIEAAELVPPERLSLLDLRPPIARSLLQAIEGPASFQTTYLGRVFTEE